MRLANVLFLSVAAVVPCESFAQGVDVGVSGVGIVSIQPRDDSYVGSPYLNEGLGGIGPGFGAGISVMAPRGFVAVGEITTARLEVQQYGRLVGTGAMDDGAVHTSRLHDSLLCGLIGYARSAGRTRVLFLGGIHVRLDEPTIDGVPRESEASPIGFTGGLDVLSRLGGRATLVVGGRYSAVPRENLIFLGTSPHVFRFGAGVRVQIN